MRMGAALSTANLKEPKGIAEYAKALVSAGFDSLWSAQSVGRGFLMADPLMTLAVAATVTEEVELGTAIVQLPFYSPADVAIRSFTLMQMSGGRFILGVGAGSTAVDHKIMGRIEYEDRFKAFNRDLAELRQWFKDGKRGEEDLKPWSHVKGGPPIFYGTWGKGVKRAVREFDGWIASGHYRTLDELDIAIKEFRDAGGQRAVVSTIHIASEADMGQLKDKLDRFEAAGFDDAVVVIYPGVSIDKVRALVN